MEKHGRSEASWSSGPTTSPSLLQRVAEGLHELHDRDVVHRDVKSANILIEQRTGCPKLTDFGLALQLDRRDGSSPAELAGTRPYMSPEQFRSGRTDRFSDIYSLGIVLYELLVGERPFRADTSEALVRQILHDPPVPLRQRNEAIPRDLENITLKCLEKDPDRRYETAGELARDLGRFLAGEPVRARPAWWGRRLGMWCRRQPLAATLTASAILVPLVFALVFFIAWTREQHLRDLAESQRARVKASYRQTLNSLEFIADVIIEKVPVGPDTSGFRTGLERDFLGHFREVLERNQQPTDSAYYADACATYGCYAEAFGQLDDAREHYERAVAIYEGLQGIARVESLENHARFRLNLANVLHALGRREEAYDQLARCLALWEERARALPNEPPRQEVGAVFLQRGHLKARDGRLEEALEDYRLADQRWQELVQINPHNNELLGLLAGLRRNMGNAWSDLGDHQESTEPFLKARDSYLAAIETAGRITGAAAVDPHFRHELAEHYNTLAIVEKRLLHLDRALEAYRHSVDIRRDLLEKHSGNIVLNEGLARTLHNLGILYLATNDTERARAVFAEAIERRESLVDVRPANPEYRSSLANTYIFAGDVEAQERNLEAATALYGKAVESAREAVRQAPATAPYYRRLTPALQGRAGLAKASDDPDTAANSYREALAVQQNLVSLPNSTDSDRFNLAALHHALGTVLEGQGRQAESVAEFQEAATAWNELGDVTGYLRAAECHARCAALFHDDAEAEERARDEAVAALQRAVSAGYDELDSLATNPLFAAIRDDPRFRKLCRVPEAAAPAKDN